MDLLLAPLSFLLATQAAPSIVTRAPDPKPASAGDSALAMSTGQDALTTCSEKVEMTRRVVCISWINGAVAASQFTKSTLAPVVPDFCPPADGGSLGNYRELFVRFLEARPRRLANDPAILMFKQAMGASYPCKN